MIIRECYLLLLLLISECCCCDCDWMISRELLGLFELIVDIGVIGCCVDIIGDILYGLSCD